MMALVEPAIKGLIHKRKLTAQQRKNINSYVHKSQTVESTGTYIRIKIRRDIYFISSFNALIMNVTTCRLKINLRNHKIR
jgi:hypothetical protein